MQNNSMPIVRVMKFTSTASISTYGCAPASDACSMFIEANDTPLATLYTHFWVPRARALESGPILYVVIDAIAGQTS